MNLTDQVASLELCKRLKKLGVEQESYFTWYLIGRKNVDSCHVLRSGNSFLSYKEKIAAAFTVAELGEMLPHEIQHPGHICPFVLEIERIAEGWGIGYACPIHPGNGTEHFRGRYTEADLRARMRIYLIENKLVNISAGMEK